MSIIITSIYTINSFSFRSSFPFGVFFLRLLFSVDYLTTRSDKTTNLRAALTRQTAARGAFSCGRCPKRRTGLTFDRDPSSTTL